MNPTPSPTLLILAAGMGSRFGGLKQIEPVGPNGETILDYSIYDSHRAGFTRAVFIIRQEMEEAFREKIAARFQDRMAVDYVFQELDKLPAGFTPPAGRTKPWGTAHAVLMAVNAIHEPFAVINADDFYGAGSYRLLAEHLRSVQPDYAMAGFILRNTLSDFGAVARGLCRVDEQNYLQEVVELTRIERDGRHAKNTSAEGRITRLNGDELVSMNMWACTPRIFADLQQEFESFLQLQGSDLQAECYLPSAIDALIQSRKARVKVLPTSDPWFGVTYREDRAQVAENVLGLIESGAYPRRLWS